MPLGTSRLFLFNTFCNLDSNNESYIFDEALPWYCTVSIISRSKGAWLYDMFDVPDVPISAIRVGRRRW